MEDELHTSDAALMDALHSIELETPKDLYSACDIYNLSDISDISHLYAYAARLEEVEKLVGTVVVITQ